MSTGLDDVGDLYATERHRLERRAIADFSHRERARRLSVLPQISEAPEDITVAELVSRGRHPHRGFLQA